MRALAVVLALWASSALADEPSGLAKARRAFERLDYTATANAVDETLATADLTRDALIELYHLQGLALASQGKAAPARDAFKRLLVLDPSRTLPGDSSPRLTTVFFEAKAWVDERGALALTAESKRTGSEVVLELGHRGDPLKLVEAVRVHYWTAGGWLVRSAPMTGSSASLSFPGPALDWWAELVGARRAQLVVLGSQAVPRRVKPPAAAAAAPTVAAPGSAPETAPPAEAAQEEPRRQSHLKPVAIALVGAGVVSLGVAIAFGVMANEARSTYTLASVNEQNVVTGITRQRALELDAQVRTQATIANVLYVTGGLLAAAGVALFVVDFTSGASVAWVPQPGGLAVVGVLP